MNAGGEDEDPDFQLPSTSKVRFPFHPQSKVTFVQPNTYMVRIPTLVLVTNSMALYLYQLLNKNVIVYSICFECIFRHSLQQLWVPDFIGLPIYIPLSLMLHVASLPYLALAPLPFPTLAGLLKKCPEKLLSRLPCCPPKFSPLPTFSYLPSPFRIPLLPSLPPKLPSSLPLPSFPLLWSASRTLLPWVFPLSSLRSSYEPQPR